jgi:hypothetical protein
MTSLGQERQIWAFLGTSAVTLILLKKSAVAEVDIR